jgi:hypothetical protein
MTGIWEAGMSDLNTVKALIARGDKEQTIGLLASILLKDTNDLEAWMLLAELLDDPTRKRACYKQVLRLSPDNLLALKKLQELDRPLPGPLDPPAAETNSRKARTVNRDAFDETKRNIKAVPYQEPYSPPRSSTDGQEIVLFLVVGIAAFLMILFFFVSPVEPSGESSGNNTALWVGLISLVLVIFIIVIFSASNKHRG